MCRPVSQCRLGISHLQHTNIALLTKWVRRRIQPLGDLVSVVLHDEYSSSLDWEIWRTTRRGNSVFMASARTCIPHVHRFFCPWLGDRETFRFWEDNWSGHGRMCGVFPVSMHYPQIQGFWCSESGTKHGLRCCP